MPERALISVVVPMHNESQNVPLLYNEFKDVTHSSRYSFEFIFVDDGSRDDSVEAIKQIQKHDKRVRLLEFARNFGKEAATSAGIHKARGKAVIIMDADLQHPPTFLPTFLKAWEMGGEVVVGVKRYSHKENWFKKLCSVWFYRIMQKVAHTHITPHASDYRLLDRKVVDAFNAMTERNRISRGMIDWLGFKRKYIPFVAPKRIHGEASYTFRKLVQLAMNSFTAYSLVPLKLAGYMGTFILIISSIMGIFVVVERFILHDPWNLQISGTAILAIALLFLVGLVLACLGLISLYIGQIHAEVINRPLYILRPENEPELDYTEGTE
jgi:dolichol-phosphate mannosyltransferase